MNCLHCNKSFIETHGSQKYCSISCKKIEHQFRKNEWRNKNLVKARNAQENYRQKNKSYYAEKQRRRNLHLKQAFPNWANRELICLIYQQAQLLKQEVDHIIPLRGKFVSGLHVETNLRIIPKSLNCKKGNRNHVD